MPKLKSTPRTTKSTQQRAKKGTNKNNTSLLEQLDANLQTLHLQLANTREAQLSKKATSAMNEMQETQKVIEEAKQRKMNIGEEIRNEQQVGDLLELFSGTI